MPVVRHRYDCPLRWADLDLLGHVNNVRYVDYLREARGALLRACLEAAGVERHEGDGYVVVRHEVSFVAPLLFRTRLGRHRLLGHRGPRGETSPWATRSTWRARPGSASSTCERAPCWRRSCTPAASRAG
ncbi:acyl-CoA thioesterase [Nocardioides convexus]|uniref:acyl-CoA thioesterase n=1 Tax=Nocardioides convexus TaxID=2712224 RepID=UPI002418785B|nr:acyl-CoA thioesterase [Nocardioides convexus]